MKNKGFTLLELLIYVGIFAIVAGTFVGILTITLRVQGTQIGVVEISNQLNFAIQTIQRYIRESSTIDSPVVGQTLTTLSLDTGAVTISLITSGNCGTTPVTNAICVNGETLTTDKIRVSDLQFTHLKTISNHPSFPDIHSVQIKITADNKAPTPENFAQRTLQSSASPL